MSGTNGASGAAHASWGYAVQGQPPSMLRLALLSLQREGVHLLPLAACDGEPCSWVRHIAVCLQRSACRGVVLFCEDTGLACCVGNKVGGVRAVPVWTVAQAEQALLGLGANLLVVEMRQRTYFEFKQILRLGWQSQWFCPPKVACVLQELDGHAHR